MRKKLFSCFFLALPLTAISQYTRLGVAYNYLYSGQWDKAIQTYNYSRPWLESKQPLLMNGIELSFARGEVHGLEVRYHYFRSAVENTGLKSVLNLHFLECGYVFHHELGLGYLDFGISVIGGSLTRRENGELMKIDDKFAFSPGVGGKLNTRYGIFLNAGSKMAISPFIGADYTPYFYCPNNEGLLNQTKGLTGRTWTGILSAQTGVIFSFSGQKANEN